MAAPRPRLVTALLALAVLAAVLAPPAGAAPLLRRFEPVLVADPTELFAPTTATSFVHDSVLQRQTAPDLWTTVDPSPTPRSLPRADARSCVRARLSPCWRLNQVGCSPEGGISGARSCYAPAAAADRAPAVVYGHRVERGRRIVLQWWVFWYENDYSVRYPPDDLAWQTHEGDWEVVSLVLLRAHRRPLELAVSQHCTGARRAWAGVERWNGTSHPVVHVAAGSHANELSAGTDPIDLRCIPQPVLAVLESQGFPPLVDVALPGTAYVPASAGPSAHPLGLRRLTRRAPAWNRFPGTWGEKQFFHGPDPIGTVAIDTSPQGPRQHAEWRHPLAVIAGYAEE